MRRAQAQVAVGDLENLEVCLCVCVGWGGGILPWCATHAPPLPCRLPRVSATVVPYEHAHMTPLTRNRPPPLLQQAVRDYEACKRLTTDRSTLMQLEREYVQGVGKGGGA